MQVLAGAHMLADALMPVLFCGKKAILCDVLVNRVSGIFRAMIHFANLISSGISLTFFPPEGATSKRVISLTAYCFSGIHQTAGEIYLRANDPFGRLYKLGNNQSEELKGQGKAKGS